MKYPSFTVDIYGCEIFVIVDKDWPKKTNEIIAKLDHEVDPSGNAIAVSIDGNYYICFDPAFRDPEGCLYHECMHILFYIMRDFDLEFDYNNQEPTAYLLQYLITESKKLWKKQMITYAVKKVVGERKRKSSKRSKKEREEQEDAVKKR